MNYKLIRLSTVGPKHSKQVYPGTAGSLPTVGEQFVLRRTDRNATLVTSTVRSVNQDGETVVFETRNSRYLLEPT